MKSCLFLTCLCLVLTGLLSCGGKESRGSFSEIAFDATALCDQTVKEIPLTNDSADQPLHIVGIGLEA
ncbi:MAG: hypothetical protein Q7S98_04235, partial [Deltaproteobacteria bacterium]|nr:hypothetical protein [Deltaproteobacteria bacterium]